MGRGIGPHSDQRSPTSSNREHSPMPDDGDTVSRSCNHCGTQYTRVMGGEGHRNYCEECAERYEAFENKSGALTIRDGTVRSEVLQAIRDETEYDVWVDQHPKRGYLFDPDDVSFDVEEWREITD